MFKRFFSILLMFFIINLVFMPAYAYNEGFDTNKVIKAEFKTDLNINKASKGQVVQFVSTQDYQIQGFTIPNGTLFEGEIKHYKKGRWAYRRAKAVIKINKMILPNGETYNIKASTKRHVLKSLAVANVAKGIISFPAAIAVGVTGAVVIIIEAISIAGIILIGPTTYGLGRTMGSLTHGLNYKKHKGDSIQLRIKNIGSNAI